MDLSLSSAHLSCRSNDIEPVKLPRIHPIASFVFRGAQILADYWNTIEELSLRENVAEIHDTLDLLSLSAVLRHSEDGQGCYLDREERFLADLLRSIEALKKRASSLASMSNDHLLATALEHAPTIDLMSCVRVERSALWAFLLLPESSLSTFGYREGCETRHGVGGIHFSGTPLSVVDWPCKRNLFHELVHNINDTSGSLQHARPAERVEGALRSRAGLYKDQALISRVIDDLHEELVAELIATMRRGPDAMLSLVLDISQQDPTVWLRFSTAGIRLRDAVSALYSDAGSESRDERRTFAEHMERYFLKNVHGAVTLLSGLSLWSRDMERVGAMSLYLVKPHRWQSLPALFRDHHPQESVRMALRWMEAAQAPWRGDNLELAIAQLACATVDKGTIGPMLLRHASAPRMIAELRQSQTDPTTARAFAERKIERCANALGISPAYYLARVNQSFTSDAEVNDVY